MCLISNEFLKKYGSVKICFIAYMCYLNNYGFSLLFQYLEMVLGTLVSLQVIILIVFGTVTLSQI